MMVTCIFTDRMLPFSHEQFLSVFAEYNAAIWPAQVLGYAVGLATCLLTLRESRNQGLWIACGLALLWGWTGAVYHLAFFSRINALAIVFGLLFIVQAALLAIAGAMRRLQYGDPKPAVWRSALGWLLIVYSAFLYPAIGWASGISYPAAPVFGVTPCPVTLFTWGILLMSRAVPWWLVAIPAAWALVGGSAAFLLHVPQDWLLLASAIVAFLVPRAPRATSHRQ